MGFTSGVGGGFDIFAIRYSGAIQLYPSHYTQSPIVEGSMQRSVFRTIAAATSCSLLTAACAPGIGANDYTVGQVGDVARVEEGVIEAVRPVTVEGGQDQFIGAATGGVVGGALASQVGRGGAGTVAATAAAAIAGALLGAAIENEARKRPGYAYTLRLGAGELVTIVQGGDIALPVGTEVFVEYGARPRVILKGQFQVPTGRYR